MAVQDSVLGDALTYEDYLPVDLRRVSDYPDEPRSNGLNLQAEEVLHSILLLEKQHVDLTDEESDRLSGELSYIDFKLNTLLDLMVRVFAKQLNIPPDIHSYLSSTRLRCITTFTAKIGDKLYADIYLSRRFPRPVTFYATVVKCDGVQGDDSSFIELEFENMSQPVCDLLERFIFLKHRRMIASTKRDAK